MKKKKNTSKKMICLFDDMRYYDGLISIVNWLHIKKL